MKFDEVSLSKGGNNVPDRLDNLFISERGPGNYNLIILQRREKSGVAPFVSSVGAPLSPHFFSIANRLEKHLTGLSN